MTKRGRRILLSLVLGLLGCQGPGVNPTGLTGGQVSCTEGPRQTLDCRGALQQFSRDLRADVTILAQAQVGFGSTSTKLTEADAITSDLIQHYYQTCALYNACLITRQDYVARTDRLQQVQLEVRRAVGNLGTPGQQNILINPPAPQGVPAPPVMGQGGVAIGGAAATAVPGSTAAAGARVDAILGILREGARGLGPLPPAAAGGPAGSAAAGAPGVGPATAPPDLDGSLRGPIVALRQALIARDPGWAAARAVIGNFTEEGKSWTGPVGALLQERIGEIAAGESLFLVVPGSRSRGLTAQQVAAVPDPNAPAALTVLYQADLAIFGSYRSESDRVVVRLSAVDGQGAELARTSGDVPRALVPPMAATSAANAGDPGRIVDDLQSLGPPTIGAAQVQITTNRPGAGASFRAGEEIRYFVRSSVAGYLYLFHVDTTRHVVRLFPNAYQKEAVIAAGPPLEVPGPGAPFKLLASSPFGLETTFAIVTTAPLDEREFRAVEGGFAEPQREIRAIVATRGIRSGPAPDPLIWSAVTVLIRE
jgi:hypothetical protein